MSRSAPKYVIMGTPVEPGNRGVMALAASLVELLQEASPDSSVSFLLLHKPWPAVSILTNGVRRYIPVITAGLSLRRRNSEHFASILFLAFIYRLVPPLRERIVSRSRWIRSLAEADLVGDIRGGDSFSDIYGVKRFLIASLPTLSVYLVKGRMVHFPQTYGPFQHSICVLVAKQILRRAHQVLARDRESASLAHRYLGTEKGVIVTPDVAFALPAEAPGEIATFPKLPTVSGETLIGINVNGLMFNGGYTRRNMFGLALDYRKLLPELVTRLAGAGRVRILLIPHTFAIPGDVESDNEACRLVREALPRTCHENVHLLSGEYDQHQIKSVISRCDFFIGSRMHACIAALSQCVPCVGIAYSKKFSGVFESVGMSHCVIDARTADASKAQEDVIRFFQERESLRASLAIAIPRARQQLTEAFANLLEKQSGRELAMQPRGL